MRRLRLQVVNGFKSCAAATFVHQKHHEARDLGLSPKVLASAI
jgi:hypothetical protein